MSQPATSETPRGEAPRSVEPAGITPWVASLLAIVFPGVGHFYLARRRRAVLFAAVILCAVALGVSLHGNLYTPVPGRPLSWLATFGSMGVGLPYFLLLYPLRYAGDITAPGYEYGTAFLLSAGLMNLLLVLDAWDIATGRKE